MDIGNEIKKRIEESGLTVVEVSRQLGCHRTNMYNLINKPSIDAQTLMRLSRILKFDFFSLYSKELHERELQDEQ